MPGGPFPPCMAGSAASGTRWDESCHSWHSPIIPHWESSCLACVRANCPVVPAPLTTNGSNPGHYQSEHWTIKGKSVCFVWSFHLPIEIVPSKWYTTLNPERMKVLCFLWRCFPFVWNRQHLQQATKAVQGPESQATKQLASVPAQKKSFGKSILNVDNANIQIAVIEGHISSLVSLCRICTPLKFWEEHCLPTKPWDSLISDKETLWFPVNFRVSIHEGAWWQCEGYHHIMISIATDSDLGNLRLLLRRLLPSCFFRDAVVVIGLAQGQHKNGPTATTAPL